MKVFISHKKDDSGLAKQIYDILIRYGVPTYLDVVDERVGVQSAHIADYIVGQLGACTHVLPVVTAVTQHSWWVPFEIGVGTDKGLPITTFVVGSVVLPEFLTRWPYLRNLQDVGRFAAIAGEEARLVRFSEGYMRKSLDTRQSDARYFEGRVKQALGQR